MRGLGWVVALLALGACAETGGPPGRERDVPQIGLQRGGRWSVLTLRPPHLTGPHFNLLLKNGVLAGSINGPTAPGGALRVQIGSDGADGYGPLGPVSMDYVITEDAV